MCIGVTPKEHSYTPYSNIAFKIFFRFSFVGLSVLFIRLDLSMVRFSCRWMFTAMAYYCAKCV